MTKKQKAEIRPNKCSLARWLMTVLLGVVLGIIFSLPLVVVEQMYPNLLAATPFAFMQEQIFLVGSFIPLFLGIAIAIRLVAKTPMRMFIHGEKENLGKKTYLIILGLYLLGLVLSALISLPNIRPSGIRANQFLINLVLMLLMVWIQTTFEEIVFRGFFIRYACGNDIRMSRKAMVMGLLSSVLFMLAHFANPEINTQSGVQVALAALSYFATAMCMYFADIYFKSLMPGILIHWLNNLAAFVFICGEVSVVQQIALFVDASSTTGIYFLATTLLAYLPLAVYIALKAFGKKKAAV